MAYYLENPSSGSARVDVPSFTIGGNVGDFLEAKMQAYAGNPQEPYRVAGIKASFDELFDISDFSARLRLNGANTIIWSTGQARPAFGTDFTVRIEKSSLTDWELFIDGISIGTETNPASVTFDSLLSQASSSTLSFRGRLYYLKVSTSGGAETINYNPSSSNGTGSILPDDVGGNDGTLVNFTLPDAWQFYPDAGGGTGQIQALELSSVSQVNTASLLSIASNNQLNTVTATQNNSATALLLDAVQQLNSISAVQSSNASALLLDQLQALGLISAQQVNDSAIIDLTQAGAQGLGLINASQVNDSQLLSFTQQQNLQAIIAEQVSNSGLVDIESVQAVSFIAATQTSTANALTLDQFSGQVVTLIAAQQANEAQTVLISQIDSLEFLSANQVSDAQTFSIAQSAELNAISAQQFNVTNLLNIVTSGDNTDLTGLTITPITNIYTLSTTKDIYTLEKQQ